MNIEAVVTCVDYADFLAWTLPHNKQHFNRLVVVTSLKDKKTHAVCEHNHVECLPTNVFFGEHTSFHKARGINHGLSKLALSDWVLHMDADIWLPPRTREILEKIDLDPEAIYGTDRLECKSFEDWVRFVSNPEVQHRNQIFVMPGSLFQVGVRIAQLDREGYLPIGFFQLWNAGKTGVKRYPEEHATAARSDMRFALQWPRRKRRFIPEIFPIHIESECCPEMGANWDGRTTRPFTY